jgi:hypothetical protein
MFQLVFNSISPIRSPTAKPPRYLTSGARKQSRSPWKMSFAQPNSAPVHIAVPKAPSLALEFDILVGIEEKRETPRQPVSIPRMMIAWRIIRQIMRWPSSKLVQDRQWRWTDTERPWNRMRGIPRACDREARHCLNAERTFLSADSIVHRFPVFHSSYEMRGIVMNASRVRT